MGGAPDAPASAGDLHRLLSHFSELGASYKTVKQSADAQADGAPAVSYTVTLLRDPSNPDKRLVDCFPKIKMGARKGR